MATSAPDDAVAERAAWRKVAVPSEHGGWGLTAEPALLGLLVEPSLAGAALALAALVAFVARTPLKLVATDVRRGRRLPRTRLAARFLAAEVAVLLALAAAASARSGWEWLVPVGIAAPLVAVELWFDVRSRSRRLTPELCGAVGISAVAAAVAVAGGASAAIAAGLWLVLAARAVASIPFVRVQIERLRHGAGSVRSSDVAQVLGVAIAAAAVVVDTRLAAGFVAIVLLAGVQTVWVRRPPVPAKVLGVRQMLLGVAVVLVTAAGVQLA
jgi:hypothetical protein